MGGVAESSTVECKRLTCGYHGHPVLRDVSFACSAGEVVALLGPNGSGKSTLIRAISGVLPPLAGEISLGGRSIGAMSQQEIAQSVATVPQEETHRFGFTVREVVGMGRLAASRSFFDTEEDLKAADRAMEAAECSELADRLITELSGGERQRALIARALAQDAPVLLLDEPTSHLDVGHQLTAARLFRNMGEAGRTVVAAIHDLNLATLLADRAVLIDQGGVAADLPMEELITSPILDRVYGVTFFRLRGEDGKLRVYPSL